MSTVLINYRFVMYDNNLNIKHAQNWSFGSYTSFSISCNLLLLPIRCSSIKTQLSLCLNPFLQSVKSELPFSAEINARNCQTDQEKDIRSLVDLIIKWWSSTFSFAERFTAITPQLYWGRLSLRLLVRSHPWGQLRLGAETRLRPRVLAGLPSMATARSRS